MSASYGCAEGSGGPGLLTGSEGCEGTVANGAPLDTSTVGEHTLTVTATSQDGLTASRTVTYDVAEAPKATVTTPASGADYNQGQVVSAVYSCSEGLDGPGLKAGSEGCSGTVEKGAVIETATPGPHQFSVTAASKDGQTATTTVSYTVIAPPTATITSPAAGATFYKGQTVLAGYSCSEGASGPGLKAGSEGCKGTTPVGTVVDTSTNGSHKFTVTATSQDGQSSTSTITYYVEAPPTFGRCVPAAGGRFKNSACTKQVASATGTYEWEQGPGAKGTFAVADSTAGVPVKLETTNSKLLSCSGVSGHGAIGGPSSATIELVLSGCSEAGARCTNSATAGQITLSFNATLGMLNKALGTIALDLVPAAPLGYECPLATGSRQVTLTSNGILIPLSPHKMATVAKASLTQAAGVQTPSSLEGGPVLSLEAQRLEAGKEERVGAAFAAKLKLEFEEAYEFNNVF